MVVVVLRPEIQGHLNEVSALVDCGGDLLASASADGTVRVWDTRTGMTAAEMRGHAGRVNALAVDRCDCSLTLHALRHACTIAGRCTRCTLEAVTKLCTNGRDHRGRAVPLTGWCLLEACCSPPAAM